MRRWLFVLLLAACAPKGAAHPDPWSDDAEEDDLAAQPVTAAAPDAAPPAPTHAPGTIARADLDAVLEAGPGAFLAGIDVEPSFDGGAFVGWKILSFWPGDPRFTGVDLLPGDVVTAVNDHAIQRPEEFQDVWDALRTATELKVDMRRGAASHTLVYAIVK